MCLYKSFKGGDILLATALMFVYIRFVAVVVELVEVLMLVFEDCIVVHTENEHCNVGALVSGTLEVCEHFHKYKT